MKLYLTVFIILYHSLLSISQENVISYKCLIPQEDFSIHWTCSVIQNNVKDVHSEIRVELKSINTGKFGKSKAGKLCVIKGFVWGETVISKVIFALIVIILGFLAHYIRTYFLRKQVNSLKKKIKSSTNELLKTNTLLEEKQNEIIKQNSELQQHRNHLEKLVEARTSQLVKAKIKAEESDRLKTSFLENMSHEIRTPMNAIYGFSTFLRNDNLPKERRLHFLDIINNNSEALLVIIDDILDISLIETNQLKINNKDFDVKSVLIHLEDIFRLNNTKNIKLELINKDDKEKLMLFSDKVRLNQIIKNLLSNAFKYTDSGEIRFGYEASKTHIRFFVSDTGIGIDKNEQKKIFDQFYKVENNPNKLYRGTGIGLTISKKMVDLMGGDIWVDSEVGKGSTFYFTLPREIPDSKLFKHKDTIKKNKLKLENTTILIAEDDPTNYELLENLLKPFGGQPIWAQSGQEAIDFIKHQRNLTKCIVLMDIKMPEIDGYEAARQIKDLNKKIPVIAVTAHAVETEKEKKRNKIFDDYITKPIKVELLITSLAKFT